MKQQLLSSQQSPSSTCSKCSGIIVLVGDAADKMKTLTPGFLPESCIGLSQAQAQSGADTTAWAKFPSIGCSCLCAVHRGGKAKVHRCGPCSLLSYMASGIQRGPLWSVPGERKTRHLVPDATNYFDC